MNTTECYSRNGYPGNSGDHNTSIMNIPNEYYSRNGYPGNSGDHKTSIMSIPDECYFRNSYPGNSGDHNISIMSIPDECFYNIHQVCSLLKIYDCHYYLDNVSRITFIKYAHY
jgi:hypothetical protein